ncbi:unnamed protein product [Polarella glacialis]|uniref:Uncharacterized protein n=1 Tax=Polarella glacialis TaxID=89957 RepID=A0A813D4Q9_POLGL|nr:unnamed protein product [Polarella glacialis]
MLLGFPPLDFAGAFIEQDAVTCIALAVMALGLSSGSKILRVFVVAALAAWAREWLVSLGRCVDSAGRTDGPCIPASFTPYVDLPGDSMFALLALAWFSLPMRATNNNTSSNNNSNNCEPPATTTGCNNSNNNTNTNSTNSQLPTFLAFAGLLLAGGMQVVGFPWQEVEGQGAESSNSSDVFAQGWWFLGRLLPGLSLLALLASSDGPGAVGAPTWLAALDRLCFGVCIVHVRVLELIFGYLRPGLQEFSWDAAIMDAAVVVLGSFALALFVFLLVQAPCEAAIAWFCSVATSPNPKDGLEPSASASGTDQLSSSHDKTMNALGSSHAAKVRGGRTKKGVS